jgi:hypothetical protein
MIEESNDYNGFAIQFHCAGKRAKEMHSFLSSRVADGSDIRSRIRDVLNNAARVIAHEIAQEPHESRPDLNHWNPAEQPNEIERERR